MEDNKTIAFDSDNFYIEKLHTIRTEGQKIVRGISSVLNNCYALYYEYAESVKGGEEDFKAFLTKQCQRKEIGVSTYDNDGTIPRLIVHFVFEGLDRRTRSKYGKVIEDAHKCKPSITPSAFEGWFKDRGGLNPKKKDDIQDEAERRKGKDFFSQFALSEMEEKNFIPLDKVNELKEGYFLTLVKRDKGKTSVLDSIMEFDKYSLNKKTKQSFDLSFNAFLETKYTSPHLRRKALESYIQQHDKAKKKVA